jgi:hypothetical protein
MKRKAKKALAKKIKKATKKYGIPAVLAFLSTVAANLLSDSVNREIDEEQPAAPPAKPKKGAVARGR